MSEHETIADIIAEMRGIRVREFQDYADRLEAAHRREVEATAAKCCQLGRLAGYGASEIKHQQESVGNAAKLREALLCIGHISEYLEAGTVKDLNHAYRNIQDRVNIALAAPARNCDALSAQEQTEKFNQFCQSHRNPVLPKCAGCPLEDIPDGTGCAQAWAQMPYEEGGKK